MLVRLGTSDLDVFQAIFYAHEYDWDFSEPPAVIVDAGAYIGLSAAWFAKSYPDARIIAIEPSAENFALLERNTNDLENVSLYAAALWSSSGHVALGAAPLGHDSFRVDGPPIDGPSNDGSQIVEAISVIDVLDAFNLDRINLLKVDIEGSEIEVFSSSEGWIGRVDAICLELHDRFRPGCSRAFYGAVTQFPVERHRGENVLVCRDHVGLVKAR